MREVFDDYVKDADVEIPKPDLSFMHEESRTKKAFRRMPRVAACVLVLFVASGSMAVWVNSESAHALKFNMEKTFHKISSTLFSTSESGDENFEEDRITIYVNSMDDIQNAVDFMPNLPIPGYIPEGFELDELEVTKFLDGTYTSEYEFCRAEDERITITSRYDNSDAITKIMAEAEAIELNDRIVYCLKDSYTSMYSISFYYQNLLIDISSTIDEEALLKVAERIF